MIIRSLLAFGFQYIRDFLDAVLNIQNTSFINVHVYLLSTRQFFLQVNTIIFRFCASTAKIFLHEIKDIVFFNETILSIRFYSVIWLTVELVLVFKGV